MYFTPRPRHHLLFDGDLLLGFVACAFQTVWHRVHEHCLPVAGGEVVAVEHPGLVAVVRSHGPATFASSDLVAAKLARELAPTQPITSKSPDFSGVWAVPLPGVEIGAPPDWWRSRTPNWAC